MTPYVSIITITMNHLKYITEMLNPLFTIERSSMQLKVIIVDKSDDTTYLLKKNRFKVITRPTNSIML